MSFIYLHLKSNCLEIFRSTQSKLKIAISKGEARQFLRGKVHTMTRDNFSAVGEHLSAATNNLVCSLTSINSQVPASMQKVSGLPSIGITICWRSRHANAAVNKKPDAG